MGGRREGKGRGGDTRISAGDSNISLFFFDGKRINLTLF